MPIGYSVLDNDPTVQINLSVIMSL